MVTEPTPATRAFIAAHADDDVRQLALRYAGLVGVDMAFALDQIAGRQQARRKLPTWAATEGIIYPPHLSMEQCSSEPTARYKAAQVSRLLPERDWLVDLTGGLGVDFSFMAPLFRRATYVERNPQLCAISSVNLPQFVSFADCVCADAGQYLATIDHASLLFLDPARRDAHGARTYGIGDCTPDVLSLRDQLLQRADVVMLKLSPMLDWRKAVDDLGQQHVSEVHIVSVGNECKELLLVLRPVADETALFCVNDEDVFVVRGHEGTGARGYETTPSTDYSRTPVSSYPHPPEPTHYLYEPNASLMKAGCFDEVARRFGVGQLSANSHLFVADHLVADFPGRRFQILAISSMNKRELRAKLGDLQKANLAVRNFPLSVAELRKRLKLGEGGSDYLFATTLADGSHTLLRCRKV